MCEVALYFIFLSAMDIDMHVGTCGRWQHLIIDLVKKHRKFNTTGRQHNSLYSYSVIYYLIRLQFNFAAPIVGGRAHFHAFKFTGMI